MILVKVARQGSRVKEFAFADCLYIREVITAAELDYNPETDEILWNNQVCNDDMKVANGDFILIKDRRRPAPVGNSWEREPFISRVAIAIWNVSHAPDIKTAERIVESYLPLFRKLE